MKPLHTHTPLLMSHGTLRPDGGLALLKMDALQPSGSFKMRGVGHLCQLAAAEGAAAIIVPSGGNAGIAAAIAGGKLGMPVYVVVPTSTSDEAKALLKTYGADVEVRGASFDDAAAYAKARADDLKAVFVHPFDDERLWAGHASLIDEVVADGESFDCIITSVGGGGLLLGLLDGLKRNGLEDVPVFSIETVGADSLSQSVDEDHPVTLDAITSVASSLGARRVADAAFEAVKQGRVTCLTVTDRQAVDASAKFLDDHRVLVEPACGAALASLNVHADQFAPYQRPLVVVCGGAGISSARLEALLSQVRS